ncbi:MAG: radical SAM protein [Oscillospiraceae bacterium]
MDYDFTSCTLCPRECGADRTLGTGFCGGGAAVKAAKAYLHMWEEPCLSGTRGAGTVFFSGCSLKCLYCQNHRISSDNFGAEISENRLAEIFLGLQERGAHCIDLVSPTHFVPQIISALDKAKDSLHIPVVYNCGGYEKIDTLKMLEGYIDVYLPDLKYMDSSASAKYSGAADYFQYASRALEEMCRQTGECRFDDEGIMQKGVIVRHMILPGMRKDSAAIMEWLADKLPRVSFRLSLMSQYTPCYRSCEFREINRRLSTFEYEYVLDKAIGLGLDGYMQDKSSADSGFTPDFDLSGII